MKQVVLLRVGIDAGCGGIQEPLFKDGSFDFFCIPDNKNKRVSVHTYGNMVGKDGKPLAGYFAEARRKIMAEQHAHVDPERETFTYGDATPPKRSLPHLKPGDLLVFYCGLQEWDAESGWNSQHRPALYLTGYFEVALAAKALDATPKKFVGEATKRLLSPPNKPAKSPEVMLGNNLVSVSGVNVTDPALCAKADKETLDAFAAVAGSMRSDSMETTHGMIQMVAGAPFLYVSEFANAVGKYREEVKPNEYAQNFVAAHNAAIGLVWLLPEVVQYL